MKTPFLLIIATFIFLSNYAQIVINPEEIKPLSVGNKIPNQSVKSLENETVLISEVIENQKTVLLFYRGGWCPYCNKHLSAVGELKDEIETLGYQIIGISPDAPEQLNKSIKKNALGYQLFSDSNTELIQKMGIASQAPERYTNMLLKYSDQNNSNVIPVPSVYVLDTNGTILYQYSNPDYKERISPEKLLEVLRNIN